ncbi:MULTISPECIES: aminotransferase class I/II-fold pyridoxal phosphate-dependent enzyme [Tepidimonas]|jgi:histidinol-phosphate aminotransferase|uniref:aminotransferase class I/II-fold pyridoxal phosphate-dependent enzyme n=1 Tax=Tepidimonas TaxID=114248 RepID=UPI00391A9241
MKERLEHLAAEAGVTEPAPGTTQSPAGPPPRTHGGPDADGVPPWDFSANANACGPCPQALARVQAAARRHYPDPAYAELRRRLADGHGVAPHRVLLAASGSEWILRFAAWCARRGYGPLWWPVPGYGDYAHAARVWGLAHASGPALACAGWLCDPGSPLGQPEDAAAAQALLAAGAPVTLDLAYAPLRLQGEPALTERQRARCWQLYSPNKALGLTGVRAAYVIAPEDAGPGELAELQALAPSWPIGADGVALLAAWIEPSTQRWLQATLGTLAQWKAALVQTLQARGWEVAASVTPFACARPPQPLDAAALRARGVKLRDAASFGLPGWWRLSAQPPQALQALAEALDALAANAPTATRRRPPR